MIKHAPELGTRLEALCVQCLIPVVGTHEILDATHDAHVEFVSGIGVEGV